MGVDNHILSDRRLPFSRPQVAHRLEFPRSGFVQWVVATAGYAHSDTLAGGFVKYAPSGAVIPFNLEAHLDLARG